MPGTASGTQAIQFTCNSNDSQYWQFASGSQGTLLKNLHTGLCLDIKNNDPDPGGAVVQEPCDGSDGFQNWFLGGSGTVFVFYDIATRPNCGGLSSECAIHPDGNSSGNGAQIYVNTPTGNCTLVQTDCFYAWIRYGPGKL